MSQHELFLLPPTRPVFRLNNAFNPDAPLLEKCKYFIWLNFLRGLTFLNSK